MTAAAAPAPATVPKVPRIVTLVAFGAGIVWANRAFPDLIPAILILVLLYVALTNLDRVDALLGGFETSVTKGFAAATPSSAGGGPKTS